LLLPGIIERRDCGEQQVCIIEKSTNDKYHSKSHQISKRNCVFVYLNRHRFNFTILAFDLNQTRKEIVILFLACARVSGSKEKGWEEREIFDCFCVLAGTKGTNCLRVGSVLSVRRGNVYGMFRRIIEKFVAEKSFNFGKCLFQT
jgi:hypothetical protein